MTQGVQEQVRILAPIEAESHFVQVCREMFRTDLMPRSHDAALQERECRFDRISCDTSAVLVSCILPCQMVDGLVLYFPDRVFVGRKTVSNEYLDICAHVLSDVFRQRPALGIFGMEESQIAVALAEADDHFFVGKSCTLTSTTIFPADIGFVHLNSTVKHGLVCFFHGRTDAMTEIPCRLVGTFVLAPDRALELVSTHAFLGFTKQQRREKPLLQWQMGIVEDRSSRDGELIVAILAVEELLRGLQFDDRHLAARALRAIWPAQPDKNLAAFFVSVKKVDNVD